MPVSLCVSSTLLSLSTSHHTSDILLVLPSVAPHLRSKALSGKTPATIVTTTPTSLVASLLQHENDTPPLSPRAFNSTTLLPPMTSPRCSKNMSSDVTLSPLKNTMDSPVCLLSKELFSESDSNSKSAYTQNTHILSTLL